MRSQFDRPVPLGPDSLTWKYFGDWRGMLQGVWAGSMQNMHPGLGAGVEQHSTFFDERWQRLYRSLYPIGGVVFDGDRAEETAHQVRGYHNDIKGIDLKGRTYHALDPDTFYWAHATFVMGTVLTAECCMVGLTETQKVQLFDEHVEYWICPRSARRRMPPGCRNECGPCCADRWHRCSSGSPSGSTTRPSGSYWDTRGRSGTHDGSRCSAGR